VETVRGRGGGLRLARPASAIVIGDVVRHTEDLGDLVDCSTCRIAVACGLPPVLAEASLAFLAVLDRYRLSDVVARPEVFAACSRIFPTRQAWPDRDIFPQAG
jgi:transcriptional regulator, BadM/Rrf2 family